MDDPRDRLTSPQWAWRPNPPADPLVLTTLQGLYPQLPDAYLGALAIANGGEGPIAVPPGWCQLWKAEDIAHANDAYEVPRNAPDFIAIGSSGGGEMLAFRA